MTSLRVTVTADNLNQDQITVFHLTLETGTQTRQLRRSIQNLIDLHYALSCELGHDLPAEWRPETKPSLDNVSHYLYAILANNRTRQSVSLHRFLETPLLKGMLNSMRKQQHLVSSAGTLTNNQTISSAVQRAVQQTPIQPNAMQLDQFQLIRVLGKGCMGKVLLVRHVTTHQLFALKSIHKQWLLTQNEVHHALTERHILALLANSRYDPFLVRMHRAFQSPSELFLLLDYYPGGDLATLMTKYHRFPVQTVQFYAAEILLGLIQLHSRRIVWRDCKPENILLGSNGHLVMTDFGLSKLLRGAHSSAMTFCGTSEYLAPEVLRGEPYSFPVDIWSWGTVLYEMLCGITPFWAENQAQMYQRVLGDKLVFPENIPATARDLLCKVLQRDPHLRIGLDEIQQHFFFHGLDWSLIRERRINAPHIPVIKNEIDASHFDAQFTSLPAQLTPATQLTSSVQMDFIGFSFEASHPLDS